jgi:tetratricopeptide (TPR) repeat protein
MKWPVELAKQLGRVYEEWRSHISDPLSLQHPEEAATQEFLRYYLIGNEAIIGRLMQEREEGREPSDSEREEVPYRSQIPEPLLRMVEHDLNELYWLIPFLPVDVVLRIHSLRFYFNCLTDQAAEVEYECEQLRALYREFPEIPVLNPNPEYRVATKAYLEEHTTSLARSRELEELTQYYNSGRYAEIVDLLSATLESAGTQFTPGKDLSRAPNRETQIDILIESLFHVGQYVRCIKWSVLALSSTLQNMKTDPETGEMDRELSTSDWSVVEAYLLTIESCLDSSEGDSSFGDLSLDVASKMAGVLIDILGLQIGDPTSAELAFSSVLPWILLHKLIYWAEERSNLGMEQRPLDPFYMEASMKGSLSLLCSAHDYLGQKSCCTLEQGGLLNYILDIFVPILKGPLLPSYADQLKTNLDQAIFCLFAHPSKKTRAKNLADHNVSQIALSWERALVVYRYVKPLKIPEHDDVKILSISSDLEVFLRRMVALIPESVELNKRKAAALRYVQGKTSKLKVKKFDTLPHCVKDLFYLLADHTFKSKCDINRAIEFYCLDISFNPDRFDSWAALALSWAQKMDRQLNSCRKLDPAQILENSRAVQTCFRKYLKLNQENSNLWIEFGNFSYNIHSYISRTLQNNSEDLTMDMFEILERKKEELLKQALACYEKTLEIFEREGIDEDDVDERWLVYFMMGKIKEKYATPIVDCLEIYLTSMKYLKKNKVVLPRKINYDSPQTFALEALEVYYRVHASVLKHLARIEANKERLDTNIGRKIYDVLRRIQLDPLYNTNAQSDKTIRFISERRKRKTTQDTGIEPDAKTARPDTSPTTIMRDVLEVVDALIEEVEFNLDEEKFSLTSLIELSLAGLEDVVYHFFHHFKALYRLANYFHTSVRAKNPQKVQQFLMASSGDKSAVCPGLFFGRKPHQVFNEVWRIPIGDIDRPGSFATYCCKSLVLLVDVLKSMKDIQALSDISLQLKKYPTG